MHQSTSDVDLNQCNGVNRTVGNPDCLKVDKKKRDWLALHFGYLNPGERAPGVRRIVE
jgi:hypothetical protein